VTEIQGRCFAGLKVGDKIVIRVPIIDVRESDNICMNAFSAMMPYIRQWSMEPFPLTARVDVCCPDPGPEKGGREKGDWSRPTFYKGDIAISYLYFILIRSITGGTE